MVSRLRLGTASRLPSIGQGDFSAQLPTAQVSSWLTWVPPCECGVARGPPASSNHSVPWRGCLTPSCYLPNRDGVNQKVVHRPTPEEISSPLVYGTSAGKVQVLFACGCWSLFRRHACFAANM